jgi:hypothetical protein
MYEGKENKFQTQEPDSVAPVSDSDALIVTAALNKYSMTIGTTL